MIIKDLFLSFLGVYVLLKTKLTDILFGIMNRPMGEIFWGKAVHTKGCAHH